MTIPYDPQAHDRVSLIVSFSLSFAYALICVSGANLLGVAHMDELAYSLNGQNFHYGTPVNKAAPNSVPGGSSSGSAVRFPGFSHRIPLFTLRFHPGGGGLIYCISTCLVTMWWCGVRESGMISSSLFILSFLPFLPST